MEIVITHTIHPEVMALLKSFISPNGGGQIAPAKEAIAAPVKNSKAKAETVKQEPVQEAVTETAVSKTEEKELEFTDIRKLYLQKKEEGKQDKVPPILKEFGADRLSAVKPEDFKAVYEKLKAL